MSAARRQIGAILLESGRITADDVERVLEYQRQHGGFFGQGLVTLGIVSRDELDWALANQLDLPYIFPNAAAVDRDAAALVTPDWALANLAVPIVRTGNALTVVAAEPLDDPVIEQLRTATGLEIEMALASATRVRELIHDLYGDAEQTATAAPISLSELFAEAVEAGADALGVSARRAYAIGWYRSAEMRRYRLYDGWAVLLNDALAPAPRDRIQPGMDGLAAWDATLRVGGQGIHGRLQVLAGDAGIDYLFTPQERLEPRANVRSLAMPDAVATELRMLYRSGSARVAVVTYDDDFTRTLVPHLPRMFAQPEVRAIHLADEKSIATFSLRVEDDPVFIEGLRAFAFDVVTIETSRAGLLLDRLMSVAPLSFVAIAQSERPRLAEHGLTWMLTISHRPDGPLAWELLPVGG